MACPVRPLACPTRPTRHPVVPPSYGSPGTNKGRRGTTRQGGAAYGHDVHRAGSVQVNAERGTVHGVRGRESVRGMVLSACARPMRCAVLSCTMWYCSDAAAAAKRVTDSAKSQSAAPGLEALLRLPRQVPRRGRAGCPRSVGEPSRFVPGNRAGCPRSVGEQSRFVPGNRLGPCKLWRKRVSWLVRASVHCLHGVVGTAKGVCGGMVLACGGS
eukprot:875428-Rhodomonas_salina.2